MRSLFSRRACVHSPSRFRRWRRILPELKPSEEVFSRTFSLGQLPIMNAYDAATLQHKKDLDLNADLSSYLLLVPPNPS